MPGRPAVSNPSLGLCCRTLSLIASVPVRSLLTKKIAPPPSAARLPAMSAAGDREPEAVAVVVDRAAAAATGRAGPATGSRRCPIARLPTNRLCATFHDTPMLLSAPPLLHTLADEATAHDRPPGGRWNWREHAHRCASDVGPASLAAVPDERGLDDAQTPAAHEDRAATAAVEVLAGGVAVGEGEVLDDQPRRGLVLAVRRREHLGGVAGVHVQDAAPAGAAQRDQAAPVEDDLSPRVEDLGGRAHPDRDGLGPAREPDPPPARTAATTAEEVQLRAVPRPITRAAAGSAAANGADETPGWGRDDDPCVEAGPTQTTSAPTHAAAAARRPIAGMLGPSPELHGPSRSRGRRVRWRAW